MQYIFYKKKLINGKKRRVYKKKGSKKLYLKHKGRMVNVVKYKKYLKRKQKKVGGIFFNKKITLQQRAEEAGRAAVNFKEQARGNYDGYKRRRAQEAARRARNAPDNNPRLTTALEKARLEQKRNQEQKRWRATQNKRPQFGIFNFTKKNLY